jgi:hypothetical protein
VTLSKASSTSTTVNYTVGGTASSGADFAALTGTLVIPAGSSSGVINVAVPDDNIVESTETVQVTLTSVNSPDPQVSLGSATAAVVNIADNDAATVSILATSNGQEPGTPGQFTVSLSKPSSTATVINYTVGGTATPGVDYDGVLPGIVTIPAGQTEVTINVPVLDDSVAEGSQTVVVTLGAIAGDSQITRGTASAATLTIVDDDVPSVIIENATGTEGGTITFTATLTKAVPGGFTVRVSTVAGSATGAGVDFINVASQVLTFAGTANETVTFTVTTKEDTIVEPVETFSVVLSNVSNPVVDIADTALGLITDNDTSTVSIADVTVAEGGIATFTMTLGNAVSGGFSVDVSTVPGLASGSGIDFTNVINRTIAFTGTAGERRTFTVATTNDTEVEGNETFTVAMSNATNPAVVITGGATGTITDSDTATVSISASIPNAAEGGASGQFLVSLSAASSTDTIVTYALSGTADASDRSLPALGTVTIPAGATSALINVVATDDSLLESSETVVATLTGLLPGTDPQITLGTVREATVTLADNENGFSISTVRNGAEPGTSGQFRVTLTRATTTAVVVNYSVSGTAVSGVDFSALPGSVTIPAGSSSAVINVPVLDDATVDPGETVRISLTSASGSANLVPGEVTSATLTILDNDAPGLVVSASGQTVTLTEGQAHSFTVVLNGVPSTPVMVTILPTSVDLNLGAGPGKAVTLTFTPFNANVPQTVTVTAIDDALINADRSALVRFTTASSSPAFNGLAIAPLRVNIVNNDVAPPPAPAPVPASPAPAPAAKPVSLGSLATAFRDLGNPDSVFAGYAGPNTVQAFQSYYPGISYGQTGSILSGDGTRQALVPVLSATTPSGWSTQVSLVNRSGAVLVSATPPSAQGGAWLVALPGVNLVDAVWADVVIRPAQTGYAGVEGSPDAALPTLEEMRFRVNVSGLFDDLDGLFETGLLQDQGEILGQALPSVRL